MQIGHAVGDVVYGGSSGNVWVGVCVSLRVLFGGVCLVSPQGLWASLVLLEFWVGRGRLAPARGGVVGGVRFS